MSAKDREKDFDGLTTTGSWFLNGELFPLKERRCN